MTTAAVTSKGQVTIPKRIRDALGVDAGDRVIFRVRDDGVVEIEPQDVDLMSLCGIFEPEVQGVTVKEMNETIRRVAGGS